MIAHWLFFLATVASLGYFVGLARCVVTDQISIEPLMVLLLGGMIALGITGVLVQPFDHLTAFAPRFIPLVLVAGGVVGLVGAAFALNAIEKRGYPPTAVVIATGLLLSAPVFGIIDALRLY